jgi:drug/metabolite transporter (DMT)-like permease
VAVLLGVLVAMSFGSGDFLGGRAAERNRTITVLFVSQVVALTGAIVVTLVVSADVGGADLAFGALAGAANVAGLGLLYHGLAHGRIGVVAPLTAVIGALVPIGWALITGERPSAVVLVGAFCAVCAGALIAREPEAPETASSYGNGAVLALAAGALLGSSLVLFAETSEDSGFWPVFSARSAAVVGVSAALLITRAGLHLSSHAARKAAVGAGVLDLAATTMLLIAVRRGLVVVVAPIASLAPAFTVVWAWLLLHERVSRMQLAGLALALVGLVLVAAG